METLSLVAGMAGMKHGTFVLTSLLGTIPACLIYAYAGSFSKDAGSLIPRFRRRATGAGVGLGRLAAAGPGLQLVATDLAAQRRAVEDQKLGGLHLIAPGLLQRLRDKRRLDDGENLVERRALLATLELPHPVAQRSPGRLGKL